MKKFVYTLFIWLNVVAVSNAFACKPTEEELLANMLGTWKVQYTLHNMGERGTGQGELISVAGPSPRSLTLHYQGKTGPMARYRMSEFIAWDPENRKLDIAWIDNFSGGITLRQAEREGNDFVYYETIEQNGKTVFRKSMFADIGKNSFVARSFSGPDKTQMQRDMTLVYTRVTQD